MRVATLRAAIRRGCVWPIRPARPAPGRPRQRDLGQLRGLARAGLAADDDDLVRDRQGFEGKVIGGSGLRPAAAGLKAMRLSGLVQNPPITFPPTPAEHRQ